MPESALDTLLPESVRDHDLPSMPAVAVQVLQLVQDNDTTLDDLAGVLSMDPALSAKLLKLSNSSLFRVGSEVTTLQRACMILGLKTVKLMALSFCLVGQFRGGRGPFRYQEFWRRSAVRAAASRALARSTRSRLADEAFLCGLLGRIGQLVLAHCVPSSYRTVVEQSQGEWPGSDLEREVLGFDSHQVSTALLQAWDLPPLIHEPLTLLHEPARALDKETPGSRELAGILRAAECCEELLCGRDKAKAKKDLERAAAESFQLDAAEVDRFVLGLSAQIAEVGSTLEIDLERIDTAEILGQARDELVRVSLGVASEARQSQERESNLLRQNEELRQRAQTDPLTGLPNRAEFEAVLGCCAEDRVSGKADQELGVLLLDVDRFKRFNDTHGHLAGDEVLKMVARVIRKVTRDTDHPARYGGEEFVVVMPRTTVQGLGALAERIRAAVEQEILEVDGVRLSVTVSVGGACAPTLGEVAEARELVSRADECLYRAKEAGRNRCEIEDR